MRGAAASKSGKAAQPDGGTSVSLELDSAVAARAAEDQMRHVVDGANVGILVLTVEKTLYVNNCFARMMGYDDAQQLMAEDGDSSELSVHPDDLPIVTRNLNKRISGEERASQYEFRLKRRDGSYVWVETNASRVTWDGVPASLSWMIDIDARKKAQIELMSARVAAETANRVKSDFLANMSHELRTPLNAIIGFSEMISKSMLGPFDPRYTEYAGEIHKSGQHLLDLINDILDLSKLEAGKLVLQESDIDLATLVRGCVDLISAQARAKALALCLELPRDLPYVRADMRALKQVTLNLLSNAIKFTDEGGRITVGIRVGAEYGLELFVSDTGIGMTPEEIKVAMEPFGQVDSRLARGAGGTGLGLPISSALMKQHGGDVSVVSVPRVGTTLIARLPAERLRPRGSGQAEAVQIDSDNSEKPEADHHRTGLRRPKRTKVQLSATLFLLEESREVPCSVLNLSPGGAALHCEVQLATETPIIIHVDDFGRFEGQVAWSRDTMVGVRFANTLRKQAHVADRLKRLGEATDGGQTSLRQHGRVTAQELCQFACQDGSVSSCLVLNLSINGASLKTDARPALDEIISIGKMSARVARYHEEGIGVEFVQQSG